MSSLAGDLMRNLTGGNGKIASRNHLPQGEINVHTTFGEREMSGGGVGTPQTGKTGKNARYLR